MNSLLGRLGVLAVLAVLGLVSVAMAETEPTPAPPTQQASDSAEMTGWKSYADYEKDLAVSAYNGCLTNFANADYEYNLVATYSSVHWDEFSEAQQDYILDELNAIDAILWTQESPDSAYSYKTAAGSVKATADTDHATATTMYWEAIPNGPFYPVCAKFYDSAHVTPFFGGYSRASDYALTSTYWSLQAHDRADALGTYMGMP